MYRILVLNLKCIVVGQMRQDSREFHRLLIELRARTDQQLEQQKTLERLLTTNAMLEQSQVGSLSTKTCHQYLYTYIDATLKVLVVHSSALPSFLRPGVALHIVFWTV